MCGIAGFYQTTSTNNDPVQSLRIMTTALSARGPDAESVFCRDNVGLGHRRLSIIDKSTGNQPIFNEDKQIAVIFNGEIYNFQELRIDLERKGHKFYTKSDTEVLVHLYEQYGLDFLGHLNGIFALALHDQRTNRLVLARDRFGVKPLFYVFVEGNIFFASELSALTKIKGIKLKPYWPAVNFYLRQLYVPQPFSAFDGISKVPAGHYIEVDPKGLSLRSFVDLKFEPKSNNSCQSLKTALVQHLDTAVARQLVADVDVGVFLSSGLDSMAVLASALKAGARPKCFTLSFDEALYDEGKLAEQITKHFGVEYHPVTLKADDFVKALDLRLKSVVEPYCAWVNVGKQLLARKARSTNVPVVLSGAGGDELFCGYPTIQAALLAGMVRRVPFLSDLGGFLTKNLKASAGRLPITFVLKSFFRVTREPELLSRFLLTKEIFGDAELFRVFKSPHEAYRPVDTLTLYPRELRSLAPIDQMLLLDIKNFLEGSILHWADNASMAESVEERVPFLDNDLVDFALKIPTSDKFSYFKVKPLLRSALQESLSEQMPTGWFQRYQKRGFSIPLNDWLNQEPLLGYLKDRLSEEALSKLKIFHPRIGLDLLSEQTEGRSNNFRKIQALLGIVNYFEKF